MSVWDPEKVRDWILKVGYETLMESVTARLIFNEGTLSDEAPPLKDIQREVQYLIDKGLWEGSVSADGAEGRLNAYGRDYWESKKK